MFSDRPGTPGRRQQMPRTTAITFTPALRRAYSCVDQLHGSTSAVQLDPDAGRPAGAREGDLLVDQLQQDVARGQGLNATSSMRSGVA
jgi:hypothetical protein